MISSEYFSAPICPFSISRNLPVDLLMDKQECRHTSEGQSSGGGIKVFTNNHHHQLKKLRSSSNPAVALGGVVSELVRQPGPAVVHREHDPALQHLLAAVHGAESQHKLPGDVLGVVDEGQGFPPE